MLEAFTMPAESTSDRINGSVITRYGNGRYGGEFRRTRGNQYIPYCQCVDRPDFTFDPCEYCEVEPADGRASNGARVCLPCFEDHHGPIY